MNKSLSLLAIAGSLMLSGTASAESIAYKDRFTGYHSVLVRIEYPSHGRCGELIEARRGAPAGESVQYYQLPITVVVDSDGYCDDAPAKLRLNKTAYIGFQEHDVKLFFVTPGGKLLGTESFAIEDRSY